MCDGPMGPCIKHPLMIETFYQPAAGEWYNARLAAKRKIIAGYEAAGKWGPAVWLHERPFRLDALAERWHRISCARRWRLLGAVLTDSENLWQYRAVLPAFLRSADPRRPLMMNAAERRALRALPETMTVYRGCRAHNRAGWSWTLDPKKAEWFARRFGRVGIVRTGTVPKARVLAHFLGRGEAEVLLAPGAVRGITEREVRDRSAAAIRDAMSLIKGGR